MANGESWGHLCLLRGSHGGKHKPPKDSGVVYQNTRIRNVIKFINLPKTFCLKLGLSKAGELFPRFWTNFCALCFEYIINSNMFD